jgi:CheY-like chemotaxis protein
MYALFLASAGVDVVQAQSGADALALVATRLPAVAVPDLRMPGSVTAADVCRKLGNLDVPVIALTGVSPGEEHNAIWRAGCASLMMKPVTPDQINRVLRPRVSRA